MKTKSEKQIKGNMVREKSPRTRTTDNHVPFLFRKGYEPMEGLGNENDYLEDELISGEGRMVVCAMTVFICIMLAMFLILFCSNAHADVPKHRAVYAIIGEAEGEPYRGKLAVACAIRNRGTLKGVYGEKSNRVKNRLYSNKVLVDAIRAWEESDNAENCSFVDGATHWEGTAFKTPYWAMNMKLVATVANQRFYRERYESEEPDIVDYRFAGIGR